MWFRNKSRDTDLQLAIRQLEIAQQQADVTSQLAMSIFTLATAINGLSQNVGFHAAVTSIAPEKPVVQ